MKVQNKFTGRIYEAIQYSYFQSHECKNFIREKMDVSVSFIQPNMRVYGLTSFQPIVDIKPTDYIIRTITDGMPLFNVVSKTIMEQNFDVVA